MPIRVYSKWFDTATVAPDAVPTRVTGECGDCGDQIEDKSIMLMFEALQEHHKDTHS